MMGCHAVVGYCEETTISDELIILSACGTAAIVNLNLRTPPAPLVSSFDRQQFDKRLHIDVNLANQASGEPGYQYRCGRSCKCVFNVSLIHTLIHTELLIFT